jgi:hypothetical protein
VVALALTGCGGGERQDANEKNATYRIAVTEASFPSTQRLAQHADMRIAVRNAGNETVPNVAVTIQGGNPGGSGASANAFAEASEQQGLADPSRPVWIVDAGPRGGTTAYVNTWALGALRSGQTKTFTWHVTAVKPGVHIVRYRVAAGLNGKARAVLADGGDAKGTFVVAISSKPADASVGPNGQAIVTPR